MMFDASNLKSCRLTKKLTQKQLSEMLGITQQAYAQYESGRRTPKLDTLQRIAKALGVDWEDLLPYDEDHACSEYDMKEIGERIRQARKRKRLSVKELADRVGVSTAAISRYERGERKPNFDVFANIADELGVNIEDLAPDLIPPPEDPDWAEHILEDSPAVELDQIDRIYEQLNTDGRLAAGKCFSSYLNYDYLSEVVAYMEKLANTPQYQNVPAADDTNH